MHLDLGDQCTTDNCCFWKFFIWCNFTPSQGQKTVFIQIVQWGMGLGMFWWSNRLRFWNLSLIYDIMKICEKIRHFKNWKPPHSYHIVPILAQKSSFQYRYLEGSKWPVLQNLSLIYIIMKIHEKKFTTLSIGILWTGTLLVFLPWYISYYIAKMENLEQKIQIKEWQRFGKSYSFEIR